MTNKIDDQDLENVSGGAARMRYDGSLPETIQPDEEPASDPTEPVVPGPGPSLETPDDPNNVEDGNDSGSMGRL